MVDWTALLLGVAWLGPQARPPVHPVTVLATHAQPTEFETRLIKLTGDELRREAESNGYLVARQDEFTFVRSKNLFNLAAMDELNASLGALIEAAGPNERVLRDRETVAKARELLATTQVASELGDALLDCNALLLYASASVTLSEGGRTVRIDLPSWPGEPLRAQDFTEIKPDRRKLEKLPRPKPYPDALVFSFGPTLASSDRKAAGSARFSEQVAAELARQNRRATEAEIALRAAMSQGVALPNVGESFQAFASRQPPDYMESLIGGFKAYGFESAGEWQAFLHGARVTRTRVVPMIGVPYSDGKINRIRAVSPIPQRNPPRP